MERLDNIIVTIILTIYLLIIKIIGTRESAFIMTHTVVIEGEHTEPVATENIKQNISSFTFSIFSHIVLQLSKLLS